MAWGPFSVAGRRPGGALDPEMIRGGVKVQGFLEMAHRLPRVLCAHPGPLLGQRPCEVQPGERATERIERGKGVAIGQHADGPGEQGIEQRRVVLRRGSLVPMVGHRSVRSVTAATASNATRTVAFGSLISRSVSTSTPIARSVPRASRPSSSST